MSDHDQGHGHGADHTPHVTPYKVYFATWGALCVLTAITVAASYVNFGPANLIIAIVIATIKAAVVGALFMHLLHDNKMHSLILVSGGLFLLIFIAFTMFDTEYRGKADSIEGERPADITRPFEGTKSLAAMKGKWGPVAGGHSTTGANPSGAMTAGAHSAGANHDGPAIPGSSVGAPSASGSSPEPHPTEPAVIGSASAGASVSASASVSATSSASVPPPPMASISPPPTGKKKP